jgi:hypothetical protein
MLAIYELMFIKLNLELYETRFYTEESFYSKTLSQAKGIITVQYQVREMIIKVRNMSHSTTIQTTKA